MALDFTTNILSLYAGNVGNDANYQSPGNFGIPAAYVAGGGVTVNVTSGGSAYTAIPNVNFNNTGTNGTGAAASARMKVATVAINAVGTGYQINDKISHNQGTAATPTVYNVDRIAPINAQTQTNFDNVAPNGTFAGGTGYANGNTITLSDNTVVTVVANAGGVVTQFSLVSTASTGSTTNRPTLTQVSTNGSGVGFSLTLHTANQRLHTISINQEGLWSVLPTTTGGTTTVAPAGGTGATVNTTFAVALVVMTNNGADYTSAPVATPSAGNATFQAVLAADTGTTPSLNERSLLTVIETLRSYFATIESAGEARFVNTVLRKMLAELQQGGGASTYSAANNATRARNEAMRFYAKRVRNPATM
jgi:hypothetical protein